MNALLQECDALSCPNRHPNRISGDAMPNDDRLIVMQM
jgi:hypothetical protein